MLVVFVLLLFGLAVRRGLRAHGIPFELGFLRQPAGIDISQGYTIAVDRGWLALRPYSSEDSNAQALITGLLNTVGVAFLAIVLSTALGLCVGVGRLSTNWVIRQLTLGFVELVRNTPLLIQLFFWYFAVILKLPPIGSATALYGAVIASQQGIYLPTFHARAGAAGFLWFLAAGIVLAGLARLGQARPRVRSCAVGAAGMALAIGLVVCGSPLVLEAPVTGKFSAVGGIAISPEMAALLCALVVNSAAFIAEMVRGAIQSVARGQWEAAAALALTRRQTLRDVVLPQAFRVIVPGLGNQYVSLTKSTSIAIAIGYPDLFNVYGTIANQTGRSLEGIILVMAAYLILSWTISVLLNAYNRRLMAAGAAR